MWWRSASELGQKYATKNYPSQGTPNLQVARPQHKTFALQNYGANWQVLNDPCFGDWRGWYFRQDWRPELCVLENAKLAIQLTRVSRGAETRNLPGTTFLFTKEDWSATSPRSNCKAWWSKMGKRLILPKHTRAWDRESWNSLTCVCRKTRIRVIMLDSMLQTPHWMQSAECLSTCVTIDSSQCSSLLVTPPATVLCCACVPRSPINAADASNLKPPLPACSPRVKWSKRHRAHRANCIRGGNPGDCVRFVHVVNLEACTNLSSD